MKVSMFDSGSETKDGDTKEEKFNEGDEENESSSYKDGYGDDLGYESN